MSDLAFLSPSRCPAETLASPLQRALDTVSDTDVRKDGAFDARGIPCLVEDLSHQGKVELRGDVERVAPIAGEELVRLSPRRGFLFTSGNPVDAIARIREQGVRAYDMSGGWAGFALNGAQLMRRLTDLDLDRLPAAGPFARVPAIVMGDGGELFRVYVPQELGHDVVLVVLDAIEGLANTGQPNTEVRLKPDPTGS